MKKIILSLISLSFILTALLGCNKAEFDWKDESFTYYRTFEVNKEGRMYVYGRDWEFHDLFIGQAVQGLFARDGGMFFCNKKPENDMWLKDLEETYHYNTTNITLNEMVQMYKDKFKAEASYILYDPLKPQSVNAATTLCGIFNSIPITKEDKGYIEGLGIKMAKDATKLKEVDVFNEYKDSLNNDGSLQLRGDIASGRDYAIACRYLTFYPDGLDTKTIRFRSSVHSWLKKDSPIFGWGPHNEDTHVGVSSESGQFTIPSDHGFNQSLYASNLGKKDVYISPNKAKGIKAKKNKHYVCITRSDGDNIQTWYNYFPVMDKDMAAPRGDFPMGWTIQPSLADLAPNVLDYTYRNADKNDYFICGVSGQGYIFPQVYPVLKSFLEGLHGYLKKTDLNLVQILDSGFNDDVIEMYSKLPNLKGGMYLFGDKYQGGKGSIRWSDNGKPFISCRLSLWGTDPVAIAREINTYKKDPTSIEGYTFVNLHPWSMDYQDVCKMVENLNDDVVVVSPEDFMDLIIENVERKDVNLS